ncbi:hypothetical protein GMDG_03917 [Pseudogymnoascus destructans 20631-21]|uniref:Uncharacterized protein n=1 Tax=Pseudogymnoascus destructans (strain ATCC MYA-4855 / 20631-21) TaxID=658429 RepID=L8GBD6_PSED2|nr:hypothetical protein GMDG_03917 [Pseudogymnoascus destructans 20631-21]
MEGRCTGMAAHEARWGNGDADSVGERERAGRRAPDWRGDHAELRRKAKLLAPGCGRPLGCCRVKDCGRLVRFVWDGGLGGVTWCTLGSPAGARGHGRYTGQTRLG